MSLKQGIFTIFSGIPESFFFLTHIPVLNYKVKKNKTGKNKNPERYKTSHYAEKRSGLLEDKLKCQGKKNKQTKTTEDK